MTRHSPPLPRGFTLAELAVVLVIVAFLIGGLAIPLSGQLELRSRQETRATLDTAREALLGFAAVHGRLPCPASAASNGVESPDGGGACTNPYDGFLPAATLGVGPVDGAGFALDGWGNRLRYAVATAQSGAFTTSGGIQANWPDVFAQSGKLRLCSTGPASGSGAAANCSADSTALARDAVAVVLSLGRDATANGTDQAENQDSPGNPVFVSHDPAPVGSSGGEFDDLVLWISPGVLSSRLLAAGRLP